MKIDVDYVILLTTPGGLARYVLGDVVRFTSVAPPRLLHVGGINLRLNAFGENVTQRDVTDAIIALCHRRHVAPLFAPVSMTGQRRGGHEWWIELKPGLMLPACSIQTSLDVTRTWTRCESRPMRG